jgi:tetratricopeptide (TPR) repeat protein
MGSTELEHLLRQGIAAARAGQKERARKLLLQVIAKEEATEPAWLWLSSVVDDPEERQICLENVLTLNPENAAAQAGLRWLAEQKLTSPASPTSHPGTPAEPGPRNVLPPEHAMSRHPLPAPVAAVEIDPHGCPYCGGPVSGSEGLECDYCQRPTSVRRRKRAGAGWPGWVVIFFALQGGVAFGEGYSISQMVQMGRLPGWLSQTAIRFLLGGALLSPDGLPGGLVEFADVVVWIDLVLAGLCVLAALGLALRSRGVYFGSFLLVGLLVMATGAGLLTQLTGLLPALLRLGMAAISLKWLVDSAPAFEWDMRHYNADVDSGLRTDLDYYNRGLRYQEMGMWAKAAAHWQVASQLASGQVQYHAALARAYVHMGYPAAALDRVDRALALAPDDEELRAYRDSIAQLASPSESPLPAGEP